MRSSTLTRSVVAVATLALSAAALGAAPATAATANGVTRAMVLTAANGLRQADAADTEYSFATYKALNGLVNRTCAVDTDADDDVWFDAEPTDGGKSADGVLVSAYIYHYDGTTSTHRGCTFAALATTDSSLTLKGKLALTTTTDVESPSDGLKVAAATPATSTTSSTLAGDVFVTKPFVTTGDTYLKDASFSSAGNATKSVKVTTVKKVADKKSKAEKKAAKAKYDKRIKSAKKSYAKALKKADTKSEKAAAKKSYSAKRASAKAKYKYAVASYKLVKKTKVNTTNVPFSVGAAFNWSMASAKMLK